MARKVKINRMKMLVLLASFFLVGLALSKVGVLNPGGLFSSQPLFATTLEGEGYIVKSVDLIGDIQSVDTDVSQLDWVILLGLRTGSERIVASFSPEDFAEESGYKSSYGLTIDIEDLGEILYYSFDNSNETGTNEVIYSYYITEWSLDNKCDPDDDAAYAQLKYEKYSLFLGRDISEYFCIYRYPEGVVADFEFESINFASKLSLKNDAVTVVSSPEVLTTASIYDGGSAKVNFKQGSRLLGVASWTGNTGTTKRVPLGENRLAMADEDGVWKLIDAASYSKYSEVDADIIQEYFRVGDMRVDEDNKENIRTGIVNLIEELERVRPIYLREVPLDEELVEVEWDEDAGRVVYEPKNNIAYIIPELKIDMAADFIGVQRTVGKPEIVKPLSDITFNNSEAGEIKVPIKNVGEAAGSFLVELADCNKYRHIDAGSNNEIYILPGRTKTYTMRVDAFNSNTDSCDECKVVVKDSYQHNNNDEAPVGACFEATKICNPGDYSINSTSIRQCNAAGSGYITVEDCDALSLVPAKTGKGDYGGYECVKEKPSGTGGGNKGLFGGFFGQVADLIKKLFPNISNSLASFLGGFIPMALLAVIVYLVIMNFMKGGGGGGRSPVRVDSRPIIYVGGGPR